MRFPPPPAVPVCRSLFNVAAEQLDLKLEAKRSRWRLW
jgi:hypothetical protein